LHSSEINTNTDTHKVHITDNILHYSNMDLCLLCKGDPPHPAELH